MSEIEKNPQQQEENLSSDNTERFQSDTQKLMRRHLEDPDHQITDEEIQNLRIGMTPPIDAPAEAGLTSDEAVDKVEEDILRGRNIEDDKNTGRITPWDAIES